MSAHKTPSGSDPARVAGETACDKLRAAGYVIVHPDDITLDDIVGDSTQWARGYASCRKHIFGTDTT